MKNQALFIVPVLICSCKYGLFNMSARKWLLPVEFDELRYQVSYSDSTGDKKKMVSVFDKDTVLRTDPVTAESNIILFRKNITWGVFKPDSGIVIQPSLDSADITTAGYLLCKKLGKWKVLDKYARRVLPGDYDSVKELNITVEDMPYTAFAFKAGQKWGLGNVEGKILLEPQFDRFVVRENFGYQAYSGETIREFDPNGNEIKK